MQQQAIEMILTRQLASYLATPIFLVDPDGTLLYYNEPAEQILGCRYDETGSLPQAEWSRMFKPTDADSQPIPASNLALAVSLRDQRPVHRIFWIQGMDGVRRQIEVTAVPLIGQGARQLGAVAFFWERRT